MARERYQKVVKKMERLSIPAPVERCLRILNRAGHQGYPVGGCVRDLLLGKEPQDWDVTTSARPEEVMTLFEKTIPTGIRHGTVTVVLDGMTLEVTTFRRDLGYSDGRRPDAVSFDATLEEDLARRDFTINAMALDENGKVIDPYGGRADLEQGLVRCVGDPDRRFGEDGLRTLRAIRFAAQLGFRLEEQTAAALARGAGNAALVSPQRRRVELEKTLLSPRPQLAVEMARLGLLEPWLPRGLTADGDALLQTPAQQVPRWRAFCRLTGLDITALPVERRLRRAVLHPEEEELANLAISGGDLCAMGYQGAAVSRTRRRLADHVAGRPEDNRPDVLAALARRWLTEGAGKKKRLFLALTFDGETRRQIGELQAELSRRDPEAVLTEPDSLHLTLVFLGDTEEEKLPLVREAMDRVTVPDMELVLDRLGFFPGPKGHLLWLGPAENPPLTALQGELAAALREGGFSVEDRPFVPHVTLGRKTSVDHTALGLTVAPITVKVRHITLMESVPQGGRHVYYPLYRR